MPLGKVYLPPPTSPPKYVSEFSFPQHNMGELRNKFENNFNHINDDRNNAEEDVFIRNNNLRNKLNQATSKKLNFNYDVDINGISEEKQNINKESGKAFRKIEIKILDTKYCVDKDEVERYNEVDNINNNKHGNGKISLQCNQNNRINIKQI